MQRGQPRPMPTPPFSSTSTPGTFLVIFALGLGTQLSTSTPDTTSLEQTATRFEESAMAFGALLIAIIAVAPATANNGPVRHRIARVTLSKLRSPVQSGVIAVGSEVEVLDIGAGVTAISGVPTLLRRDGDVLSEDQRRLVHCARPGVGASRYGERGSAAESRAMTGGSRSHTHVNTFDPSQLRAAAESCLLATAVRCRP